MRCGAVGSLTPQQEATCLTPSPITGAERRAQSAEPKSSLHFIFFLVYYCT